MFVLFLAILVISAFISMHMFLPIMLIKLNFKTIVFSKITYLSYMNKYKCPFSTL
jgi:hypothetical protein